MEPLAPNRYTYKRNNTFASIEYEILVYSFVAFCIYTICNKYLTPSNTPFFFFVYYPFEFKINSSLFGMQEDYFN